MAMPEESIDFLVDLGVFCREAGFVGGCLFFWRFFLLDFVAVFEIVFGKYG